MTEDAQGPFVLGQDPKRKRKEIHFIESSDSDEEKEDADHSDSRLLLDLFVRHLDLEWELSETPDHAEDRCGKSKTACARLSKAMKAVVMDRFSEYDTLKIELDRHCCPKPDKLHFSMLPTIIDETIGNPKRKRLFLRTGAYPFVGSITDGSLVEKMAEIARLLHHNWISPEDFEFTEFAIHGIYSEHRENAWVTIQARKKGGK